MAEEQPVTLDQAVDRWTPGMLECRADKQHLWKRLTVAHRPGIYTIKQRCTRCRNVRQRDINDRGYVLTQWRRAYVDGYLLKGLGRIDQDEQATLRLASLENATVIEVDDEGEERRVS